MKGIPTMKRLFAAIFFFLSLLIAVPPARSVVTYNCDSLTGGAQRALDYISVNDLNDGDRSLVTYSSGVSTYLGIYKYDASGVTPENTSVHPFYIRPNDYATSGVWCEIPLSWVDLQTTLSILNLTVTGTNSVVNLDASGRITGPYYMFDSWSGSTSVTLSGATLYGAYISNYTATSSVTVIVPTAVTGYQVNADLAKDMTSGSTIYLYLAAGDSILNKPNFVCGTASGTSYYMLSSTTPGESVSLIAIGLGRWKVYETAGSPSQESTK